MKTGRMSGKLLSIALLAFLVATQLAAPEEPAKSPLEQLQEKLTSAQFRIAAGDLESGLKELSAIKPEAQEKLPGRFAFVSKLAEAVAAETSPNPIEAASKLQAAAASAEETDDLWACLIVARRVAIKLKETDRVPEAVDIVAHVLSESPAKPERFAHRLYLVRLWLDLGDVPRAEALLAELGSSVGTETERNGWLMYLSTVIRSRDAVDGKLAVYDRFAAAANANGTAERLLKQFLEEARANLGLWDGHGIQDGIMLFEGVKKRAASFPGLAEDILIAERMVSAHALAKADYGAEALKAIQEAHDLAKGKPTETQDVYLEAAYLFREALKAQELRFAEQIVKLLSAEDLREVSCRLSKSKEPWGPWVEMAALVMEHGKWGTEALTVYGRLSPAAASEGPQELLLRRLLGKTRRELSIYWDGCGIDDGIIFFNGVKERAAQISDLEQDVRLTRHMVSAHQFSRAGKHADALTALQGAYQLAKGNPEEIGYLYLQTAYLIRERLEAKDKVSAMALVDFLETGPGSETKPQQMHADMVHYLTALGELDKAERALIELLKESQDAKSAEAVVALSYYLVKAYGECGRMDNAYRVFQKAEAAAERLDDATHDRLIRSAFEGEEWARKGLPTLLERSLRDRKGQELPDRLVDWYCRTAPVSAGREAMFTLFGEIGAKPRHYLILAKHLRDFGDVRGARRALEAIHKEALKADRELAKAVEEFWGTPRERARREIARTRAVIKVYEDRAAQARAKGNAALAAQYENQVKLLNEKIAALQKEAR